MAIGDANRINSNIGALSALNSLRDVNNQLAVSQLRLSTTKRINEAADDPSGYSISVSFDQRARGLQVALDGVGTVNNSLSIAEGSLTNINKIILNIRDLVVQGATDTLGSTERAAINTQLNTLRAEIDRIAKQSTFNGTNLLDGSFTNKRFQTGDAASDYISFSISSNFNSTSIGLANVSVDTSTAACNSLASVNAAVSIVSTQVQGIGATVQRLRLVETELSVAVVNTKAAYSRIMDADVAAEQVQSTRLQIIRQLSVAQLAQANVAPQNVLSLFR